MASSSSSSFSKPNPLWSCYPRRPGALDVGGIVSAAPADCALLRTQLDGIRAWKHEMQQVIAGTNSAMALEDASSVILDAGKSSPHMNQGVKLTVMFLSVRH